MKMPGFLKRTMKAMLKELLEEILEGWIREGKHIHLPFVANFKGEEKES